MTDKPHNNPARIDMVDIDDLITRLRESADLCLNEVETRREAVEALTALQRENERLQHIIDSRPAINAGLPGTYIEWSASIYAMDMAKGEAPQ